MPDAREAGGVQEPEFTKRLFGLRVEQPGGSDETRRRESELLELSAGLFHELTRRLSSKVVELTFVGGVEARRQLSAYAFIRATRPLVEVAVDDDLVPRGRECLQPLAECRVLEKVPATMMIRDHKQRAAVDSCIGQSCNDPGAGIRAGRSDIVEGDHQRTTGGGNWLGHAGLLAASDALGEHFRARPSASLSDFVAEMP